MKLDFINIWWITLRIKPGTQGLRCSNFQSGSLLHDFVLLGIFNEGVACIIKSWDIIYKWGLECNYIYIVVLNIINGNFGLVKSWQ